MKSELLDSIPSLIFNAMTDAIENMEKSNYGTAKEILIRAQQKTEELYIDAEE